MNDHERFIHVMTRRMSLMRFEHVDPCPNEFWSAPCNTPEFLAALQTMGDVNSFENKPAFSFLHIGGPLPN